MWQEERARWREYLAENDPEMLKELDAQDEKEAMEAFAGKMAFGTAVCARCWASAPPA